MGFFSPNSSDSSRGSILTRIRDTTGSMLNALADVFIRSEDSNGKEVLEINTNIVKLNEDQIKVKFERDTPLVDFVINNLKDWKRPILDSIRRFTGAVMFEDRIPTRSVLAIEIKLNFFEDWKNGDFHTSFNIISKHTTVGELADDLRGRPYIMNELKSIGYELNDQNIVNFALFHEMGHLACYWQAEDLEERIGWSTFDDRLYDHFLDTFIQESWEEDREPDQEEYSRISSAFYRELPMEHYSDEFAKFCMEQMFEPNGDFKKEIDKNVEIPPFDIRENLDDFDEIFTDIMFNGEYDGPSNLAEIYETEGRNGIMEATKSEGEGKLDTSEAYAFLSFAVFFDEIQEEKELNDFDYQQEYISEEEQSVIVLRPEEMQGYDKL